MKMLLLAISFLFLFNDNKRSEVENALETILQSEELVAHFSYLPRYLRTGEFYYFILDNDQIESDWKLYINNQQVKLLNQDEIKLYEKNFYISIEQLSVNDNEMEVVFHHRYAKLFSEEKKFLEVKAKAKRDADQWKVVKIKTQKLDW